MKIRYLSLDPAIASYRLRAVIPGKALRGLGFDPVLDGHADWAVLQKHGWGDDKAQDAARVLFDVCDDHFHDEHQAHYRKWCRLADKVTCNSRAMAEIIRRETNRIATVIDDPYESPECAPKCRAPLLWFGHRSNLGDLAPIMDELPELMVVSNVEHPAVIQWSGVAMEQAWAACGMTVIPTGKSMAKSANRAVESIRRGLYPACGQLPAYAELGLGTDNVVREVNERLADGQGTLARIRELQDVVRDRFSPQTVARKWAECFA